MFVTARPQQHRDSPIAPSCFASALGRAAESAREHAAVMSKRRDRPQGREPRSIAYSLRAVTAGFGSRGRAIDLTQRWHDAVGDAIAAHARPDRLDEGRLMVVVDDPAWATEIRYHTGRILDALNADSTATNITELNLRVHPAR